jgi:hypothetical protein
MIDGANLLHITRAREVTNARDKIYGIMALMDDVHRTDPLLRVDYNRSVLDLYLSICVVCIKTQGMNADIEFLQDAGAVENASHRIPHARVTVNGQRWPSWIPDWTSNQPESSAGRMGCLQAKGSSASAARVSNAPILVKHEHSPGVPRYPCLRVQGVKVLTVQNFIPMLRDLSHSYVNSSMPIEHAYAYAAVERRHLP